MLGLKEAEQATMRAATQKGLHARVTAAMAYMQLSQLEEPQAPALGRGKHAKQLAKKMRRRARQGQGRQ